MDGPRTSPLNPRPDSLNPRPDPCNLAPLTAVYRHLFNHFGPQHWWPARTPFEVCVGAILTQSVAWTNVEKAIAKLRTAGLLAPGPLLVVPEQTLAALIRPAGYFNAKARKLKAFVQFLHDECGGAPGPAGVPSAPGGGALDTPGTGALGRLFAQPLDAARARLLSVHGIGPETADSILLYAGGLPTFVVDAYTRRILARLGHCPPDAAYEDLRRFFMDRLPADPALFNEYHALIVALGKDICVKSRPRCGECPLAALCPSSVVPGRNPPEPRVDRPLTPWVK